MGAMSATAFSSTPWRRTRGSRTRRCGSVRYRQAAPIGAKCGQIVEKSCIRFDDGDHENCEDNGLDEEFPYVLQRGIDFSSEGMRSTAERSKIGNQSNQVLPARELRSLRFQGVFRARAALSSRRRPMALTSRLSNRGFALR